MSQTSECSRFYTTGEIAKLCGVSVRTVQYYDDRGILIPSELSEGGRRLYTEADVGRMRIICFLRDAGFSINNIGDIFAEEHPQNILAILLEQQEKNLREEMREQERKLAIVEAIRRTPGARSLDGVKRRTRAGMGRCQGGFCGPRVMEILSRELGAAPTEVTKSGGGSHLLVGKTKEDI